MNTIAQHATLLSPNRPEAPKVVGRPDGDRVREAQELKKTFSQFVGEAFFGQMLKSMRQTVGEPAYFHGGMAERQFQARLDQQLAADMAAGSGSGLSEAFFEHQFPEQAELLRETGAATPATDAEWSRLDALRRL